VKKFVPLRMGSDDDGPGLSVLIFFILMLAVLVFLAGPDLVEGFRRQLVAWEVAFL
jgi:hypothetical protein